MYFRKKQAFFDVHCYGKYQEAEVWDSSLYTSVTWKGLKKTRVRRRMRVWLQHNESSKLKLYPTVANPMVSQMPHTFELLLTYRLLQVTFPSKLPIQLHNLYCLSTCLCHGWYRLKQINPWSQATVQTSVCDPKRILLGAVSMKLMGKILSPLLLKPVVVSFYLLNRYSLDFYVSRKTNSRIKTDKLKEKERQTQGERQTLGDIR